MRGRHAKVITPAWHGKHYKKTQLDLWIENIHLFCIGKRKPLLLCEHNNSCSSSENKESNVIKNEKFIVRAKHEKIEQSKMPNLVAAGLSTALVFGSATATISYLMQKNSISNQFTLGTVTPEITEKFDTLTKTKSNVAVQNVGNVPIYVRLIIIMNWKDANGNIVDNIPLKDTDYNVEFSNSLNWIKNEDGYYYYKLKVEPNQSTDVLINTLKQIKEYENKNLIVDIIAQSIQAEPIEAVKEAWNVDVVEEKISFENI